MLVKSYIRMLNKIQAGVYIVVYNKELNQYSLELYQGQFKLPPILYGDVERHAIRVWNTFALSRKSTGILLTGESGSGKSLLAEVICNKAISKDVPVIYITAVEIKPELLQTLQRLTDVVIYIDEFGKCSEHRVQDKMLSFLSDTNTRKLFILTENDQWMVNRFILNRPGRIRYHLDYKKIPKSIVIDYLNRNVEEKDKPFREAVYNLYKESKVFSFDHLQTLVSEHERYPEDDLDTLLDVLNMGVLAKPYMVNIKKVINLKTKEELKEEDYSYKKRYEFEDWTIGRYPRFNISIKVPAGDAVDGNGNQMYINKYLEPIYESSSMSEEDYIWNDENGEFSVVLNKVRPTD